MSMKQIFYNTFFVKASFIDVDVANTQVDMIVDIKLILFKLERT